MRSIYRLQRRRLQSRASIGLRTATVRIDVVFIFTKNISHSLVAPVIIAIGIVGDLLTVATLSHPILRRSSRVYQQLTILAITDLVA